MSIAYTPVGTPVLSYYPVPGEVAPVAGFRYVAFSIEPTGAQGGDWSDAAMTPGFIGSFGYIIPPEEGLYFCTIFQTDPPPGAYPISTNPLPDVWRRVWTPSTYAPREVAFRIGLVWDGYPQGYVYRGLDPKGNPLFGYAHGNWTYGQTVIPIVPAPGSLAAILGLGMLAARRRR